MKHILLGAGFVLAGSLDYDPHVLTLRYPDGRAEQMAATSAATCNAAVRAIWSGLWQVNPMPVEATCAPGNLFRPHQLQPRDKDRGWREGFLFLAVLALRMKQPSL